jgi:Tol biopolymer transport system component
MKNILLILIGFLLIQFSACNDEPIEPVVFGSLEGLVIDATDQSIISGAEVSTAPVSNSLITDAEGKFVMNEILAGEYDLIVEKDGYINGRETIIINNNGETQVTVFLQKKSVNNFPPEPPTNEFPTDLSEDIGLSVNLSWTSTDSNSADSLTYDVLLYSDNTTQFETIASDIKPESFLLDELTYGTLYFWQVIVKDGVNDPVYGPIWQFQTIAFPDNRILFVRRVNDTYQIFSGDEDGNELQLTNSQSSVWRPRFNPQKNKIAFISLDGFENHLYTMNPNGTNIQKVTETISIESFDEDYMSFCWSPNGASLVYMNYNQLYKISPDGSGLELIIEIAPNLSYTYVDWTNDPTARLIIRTSTSNQYDGDLYMLNLDGSGEEQIFSNIPGRLSAGSFSVDGNKILFTHDISGFENQDGKQLDARIQILDLNNNNYYVDFSFEKPAGTNDLDPRYSPDGANIIFTNTNNDGVSVKNIYKVKLDDITEERMLLFENAEMPDWK